MGSASEETDLQAVGCGGDHPRAPGYGSSRSDHHVLAEHDGRLRETVEQAVVDHGLSSW
jgi:hypothetical protein